MSTITLLTDFGSEDAYVGVMKGVILSVNSSAKIIDISHAVDPQDLIEAAYLIKSCYRYFPEHTVHIVVVDPGVGSDRAIVALEMMGHVFLAPNNGVLTLLMDEGEIDAVVRVENTHYFLNSISQTFHGRDIFAPVAAHLAAGWPVEEVGPEIKAYSLLSSKPAKRRGNRIEGEVTAADRYGNVILNIPGKLFEEFGIKRGRKLQVHFKNKKLMIKWAATYGEVPEGEGVILISGGGFLELAVNRGNAARKYGLEVGEAVILEKPD
ncbi:MAG: SAM-dependent chlorinase/fluorinase [Deltaproteobacteria bacterium]|nr:SAM-dependent chlorinase/fluorinase [Deltaproteobacteria bacterium]